MPERALTDHLVVRRHIHAQVTTTQTPSSGIDVSDLAKAEVIVGIGDVTNLNLSPNSGSWTFTLQHSDSQSASFEAVAATDVVQHQDGDTISNGVFATIDAAGEDGTVKRIGYVGNKNYIRVVATAASTPGASDLYVIVVGEPKLKPASDS